jgi:carbamoyl-phosphate synthase small subunit
LQTGAFFAECASAPHGQTVGEVVFNTAMTGYQEILTDPSYAGQLVTLTYPHIGNTGANAEDVESRNVYAAGLIIRDLPLVGSNWRQQEDLSTYLTRSKVVAIGDIDTRQAHPDAAEQGRAERLHPGREIDEKAASPPRRPRRHGGQDLAKSREHRQGVRLERQPLGARAPATSPTASAVPRGRLRLRREAQHPAGTSPSAAAR